MMRTESQYHAVCHTYPIMCQITPSLVTQAGHEDQTNYLQFTFNNHNGPLGSPKQVKQTNQYFQKYLERSLLCN